MANEQNLKPFKKGEVANPNGRPKMPNLKDAIAKILAEEKDGKRFNVNAHKKLSQK